MQYAPESIYPDIGIQLHNAEKENFWLAEARAWDAARTRWGKAGLFGVGR